MEAGIASALNGVGVRIEIGEAASKKGVYSKPQHAQKTQILYAGIRVFSGLSRLKC
jgi:hypothetical protein